ncbi:hypothetical protein A2363_01450 [Candidatus Gottesmanbacteria bacterium RIFOXYB1_FULL_47_11]|uniref:Deoxynucleoside kinase domain-containing protein n=1 Tax=Candidatus Gottesmanbacteria bacterium RIFOXYB1_FULL_47_11 TaxID=1798401 RepID=A0A1F6BDX4_9BACT|nr:MAG: hypothetical protein A2363_01450 [Candidatus Gottesmanbacteria bacterium RIFOXYB1_FULL_47_11]
MGDLGVGKTTTAEFLSKNLNVPLLPENFNKNPFLEDFYRDPQTWAYHSQTFFLMEKYEQGLQAIKMLKQGSVLQDTPIEEDVFVYARAQFILGNMRGEEWEQYQRLYQVLKPRLRETDLMFCLHAQLPTVMERIRLRGRGFEKNIDPGYVALLDKLYAEWIESNTDIAMVHIETDGLDIRFSKMAQQQMLSSVGEAIERLYV